MPLIPIHSAVTVRATLRAERDALRAVVEAVRNLHRRTSVCMYCMHEPPCDCTEEPRLLENLCADDMHDWPCPTRNLIDGMGA